MAYNFQAGNNKIKLLTEYEHVIQKGFNNCRINTTLTLSYSISSFNLFFGVSKL
jgi:hypothetical protein